MFGIFTTSILIALAAGAVGALTIEHGWGWVLALYHARAAKFDAEFQAHVAKSLPTALAPLAQDIERIKQKLNMMQASTASPPAPPAAA